MSQLPFFSINKLLFENTLMESNLQSEILDIAELPGFAMHASWTGTPGGTLVVSGSNTNNINDFVPIDSQATASSAGAHLLNVEKAHYRYLLIEYNFSSGTGSLTCRVSAKRV